MDKQEMIEQIEELKQRIEQLEKEVKTDESNIAVTDVRWQPVLGQTYFYLDAFGNVESINWDFDDIDYYRFNIGNCFKTRQEGEDYRENLLTKQALKDLALELNDGIEIYWDYFHQPKYYILYDYRFKELLTDFIHNRPCAPGIYCISSNFLEVAKDRIGEEKLIKLIKSGL